MDGISFKTRSGSVLQNCAFIAGLAFAGCNCTEPEQDSGEDAAETDYLELDYAADYANDAQDDAADFTGDADISDFIPDPDLISPDSADHADSDYEGNDANDVADSSDAYAPPDACSENLQLLDVFRNIQLDPERANLEDYINGQYIQDAGMSFGEIIDSSMGYRTAYSAAAFRLRIDNPDVVSALYHDLNDYVGNEQEARALFDPLFSSGCGQMDFVPRQGISVYFSRTNEGEGIMVILGSLVASQHDQPDVPMLLYFVPMNSSADILAEIENGGM